METKDVMLLAMAITKHEMYGGKEATVSATIKEERCLYTKVGEDGYGVDWNTTCGFSLRCEGPIDIGMPAHPLPNEDGAYCRFCGKLITLIKNGQTSSHSRKL